MTKYCSKCGTPLKETNKGNNWCPNCFAYDNPIESSPEKGDTSYIR